MLISQKEKNSYLIYLFDLIKLWGGSISMIDNNRTWSLLYRNCDFSESPTSPNSLGINFNKKILYIDSRNNISIENLIHEMGHLFASKYSPNSNKCDETLFLGWEFSLYRLLDLNIINSLKSSDYLDKWKCNCCNLNGKSILINSLSKDCISKYIESNINISKKNNLFYYFNGIPFPLSIR